MSHMEPNMKKRRVELDRVRIVLCGAGSWGQGWHLPQLQRNPHVELVAIVDPQTTVTWSKYNLDIKPPDELAAMYQVPLFHTFEEFLNSSLAERTDGVIISSTHRTHSSLGLLAAKANFHIFMEKPMTTNALEALDLYAAAEQMKCHGKVFMVNHSANFRQQALKAREFVGSGRIGEIQHVTCYMIREREFFEDSKNRLWVSSFEASIGNGFAWGQSCHNLAWVYMVTALRPQSVYCKMVRSTETGADIFTSAIIECRNGAIITCQGLAGLPGGNSVGNSASKTGKLIENKIFGSKGCLLYSGDDAELTSGSLELLCHGGTQESIPGFYFENTTKEGLGPESLQSFLAACHGEPVFNAADAEIGLLVVETIEAMYKSAKTGEVQQIPARPWTKNVLLLSGEKTNI